MLKLHNESRPVKIYCQKLFSNQVFEGFWSCGQASSAVFQIVKQFSFGVGGSHAFPSLMEIKNAHQRLSQWDIKCAASCLGSWFLLWGEKAATDFVN
jgi:hypothetical protein